uniref:uncharacterized protein LOC124053096 n=1 Tax=Scatophagus argus TaxID=75038 RepID=UPI001ED83EF1|nr:uncharacterized protein LOC124053096 [Scatophagus argus]
MRGGKHLLLLAVYMFLARCQQRPQVFMLPKLNPVFSGDLLYLNCANGTTGNTVIWYFNNEKQSETNKTWKIFASPSHSGSYSCESSRQKSDSLSISVMEYVPRASLTIKTGQPVMRNGGSVILQLENDGGLDKWNCSVYRGGDKTKKIKLKVDGNPTSLEFQPRRLEVPETILWCSGPDETRSNQITIRTSERDVSLEMYPLPALAGESLTLRCIAWGTDQISSTDFYKDNKIIQKNASPTIKIPNVTESTKGKYKCYATYTHKARSNGPPYQEVSDDQDVFVYAAHMKAVLSEKLGLSCDCPLCPKDVTYHWYYKNDGDYDVQQKKLPGSSRFMMPRESGTYACQAVWKVGRSFMSNSYTYKPPIGTILVIVFVTLLILGLILVAAAFYVRRVRKKRKATGAIYEDVALRLQGKGDDNYEQLQRPHGAQKEDEYNTLHPEAQDHRKKEDAYEELKKEEVKTEVYHTLGMEGGAGGAGGEGGYEALKKEGMKEGVYHTLGMEGGAGVEGGEGGYEALKKEGMKEGVYHTLGMEGGAGAAGGYEAAEKTKQNL